MGPIVKAVTEAIDGGDAAPWVECPTDQYRNFITDSTLYNAFANNSEAE